MTSYNWDFNMALSSLVSYGDSSDSESEESLAPVKKEGDKDVRKLLSVLPPAKGKGGVGKQPVRIGLPKLERGHDSDSDDEDIPSTKRQNTRGGSGLTAILPQPKGDPKRIAVPKNPTSTKTMVPYTLSKRYQDSKNRTAKTKAAALRKAKKLNSGEESDSDGDEPVSFFSHLDTPHSSSNQDTLMSSATPAMSNSYSSAYLNSDSKTSQFNNTVVPSSSTYEASPAPQLANSAPIAPKPFRITDPNYDPITGIYSYGDSTNAPPPAPPPTLHQSYEELSQTGSTTSQPQAGGWEQYYKQAEQELVAGAAEYYEANDQESPVQPQGPVKPMPGAGPGLSIDDDVFRRLAGGRKRKNWQANLNDIIDIKEDDVKEEIKIYQKYHSEEAVNKLYKPDPSSKDPTSQQKRKHQLTYLAHQAKANELQLLKHWGQSAATKRQTQMKYGF